MYLIRSSVSDDVRVGFYSCDRSVQTTESELVPIKEATSDLKELLKVRIFTLSLSIILIYFRKFLIKIKDMSILKYDLKFITNSNNCQFNDKLNDKSIEM